MELEGVLVEWEGGKKEVMGVGIRSQYITYKQKTVRNWKGLKLHT